MWGGQSTPNLEVFEPARGGDSHVLICAGRALTDEQAEAGRLVDINGELELGRGIGHGSAHRLETGDPFMSRTHCRLTRLDAESVAIRDLDSRNGTFVDGMRLSGTAKLRDGAVVFVGAHVFVYRRMQSRDLRNIWASVGQPFGPVPTSSPMMANLAAQLRRLAKSNVEILLTGEPGVGKEIMAEAIHRESGRGGSFVTIPCASLAENQIEHELFGRGQGAHAGATAKMRGLIEEANGGTLYLDEVGSMSGSAQAKLLGFLRDGRCSSPWGAQVHPLEVRLLAATRSAASRAHDRKALHLDLVVHFGHEPIFIPPLRDRIEDAGLLVQYFMRERPRPFDIEAYRSLFLNPWQGNIGELEKTIRAASAASIGCDTIGLDQLQTDSG
jgi:transcriptional regulator of aromatic amino acid metabolism